MAYSLYISTGAEKDIFDAIDYYDTINVNLGDRFLAELLETYQKIKDNPEAYSYISSLNTDRFRDVKLRSFPYVVIYELQDMEIYVAAVLNTHKKPPEGFG